MAEGTVDGVAESRDLPPEGRSARLKDALRGAALRLRGRRPGSEAGTGPEADAAPDAFSPDDDGPDRWGPSDWGLDGLLVARVIAVAAAVVAVVSGVALPFAPVEQNVPRISWPLDVVRPESTMLALRAYKPEAIDVGFSCGAARAAGATADGYLLTTMAPTAAGFDDRALAIRVRADELTVRSGGQQIATERLPDGPCSYRVVGTGTNVAAFRDGRPLGAVAPRIGQADPDEIQNVPPDSLPAPRPITALPDVDVLHTSLTALPGATASDLAVRVTVDDRYASTPSPLKHGLITAAVLAVLVSLLATAAAILLARRRVPRTDPERGPPRWRRVLSWAAGQRPRVVDLVVLAALAVWAFLAPLADDDGYYRSMAANIPFSGYLPQYYQVFTQGFTPFTWPYYVLSWWQQQAGMAPVVLRVPSVVLGVLTWLLVRSFVARAHGLAAPWREHRLAAAATRVVLAVAFLAWWLPYDITTRPEPWTAAFAAATLVVVAEGLERERVDLLGLAVGLGSIGLMTGTTGFICLAPLLVGAPATWRLLRRRASRWWELPARWLVIVAPGALGAVVGFADGTYGDFVRSQQIFAPIQRAETWYLEFERYALLLDETSRFGAYAKRTAILVCLLALVWFLVTTLVARAGGVRVPPRLMLAGWSTALAFLLLLPTPSKFPHHLGAIVGLGSAFLALLLVALPGLVRGIAQARGGRLPWPGIVAGAAAAVLVAALAGHGRNRWAFMWGLGQPSWLDYPSVKGYYFDRPVLWAAVLVGVLVVVLAVTTFLRRSWRPYALVLAVPVLCVLAMLATTTRMVADFALAADRTSTTYSPEADAWQDPDATRCGAQQALDVLGTRRTPLAPLLPVPTAEEEPPDQAFLRDATLPESGSPGVGPLVPVWGSFRSPSPGRTPEARTGTFTTGWFRLPPGTSAGQFAVTSLVSGRTGDGNTLRAEYGRPGLGPDGVATLGTAPRDREVESGDGTSWRSLDLSRATPPPPGATLVRLVATDATTDVGGWLAFTAPLVQQWQPMSTVLDPAGVYTVAWQQAFLFPCIAQPRVQDGVTQPMDGFLGYGASRGEALADFAARPDSGGIVGNSYREASVTERRTRLRDFPGTNDDLVLMLFEQPYPTERYRLERDTRTVSGLTP